MNDLAHNQYRACNDNGSVRLDPLTRVFGVIMLAGVAMITVICLLVQFLRSDLDWIRTEMSIYVLGPYGTWVQAGFIAPMPGILALGVGWYRAQVRRARSVIPTVLFAIGAVALCMTAVNHPDTTHWPVTVHGRIHQWAAFTTFLCATSAMLVQSWHLRTDPRWRRHFVEAMALASATTVYFWIYALFKPIPRGIGEKAVIALVLAWLGRAAWWLVRGQPD